jgi:flagellar hook assembly protein FlgD
MRILLSLIFISSTILASESVTLDCYNSDHEKVLTIGDLAKIKGSLVNNYDNREEFNQNINDKNTRLPIYTYRNGIKKLIQTSTTIYKNIEIVEDDMTGVYAIYLKGKRASTRRFSSQRSHQFELKSIDGSHFSGKLQYFVGSSSRSRVIRETITCNL